MDTPNRRLKLTDLNEHLVCTLCDGYLIDATSIDECLHIFCRSCIVRYLQASSFCPTCKVQLDKGCPLKSLKPDKTLQDMVYKLVPNLFHNEMLRRKTYYDGHPEYVLHTTPEQRGEGAERFYSTEDKFSLSLEYVSESDVARGATLSSPPPPSANKAPVLKHYLHCPTLFTIRLLKKFIRNKLDLPPEVSVDIFQRRESLSDDYTLLDIAYIYPWKTSAPMSFYYRVTDPAAVVVTPITDVEREMPSLRPVAPALSTPVPATPSPRLVRASRRSASIEHTPSQPKVAAVAPTPASLPTERRPPPLPSLVIKGLPASSSANGSPVTYTVTVKTPSPPQPAPVQSTPSRPKTPKVNGTITNGCKYPSSETPSVNGTVSKASSPAAPTPKSVPQTIATTPKIVPMTTYVTKLKTLAPKSLKSRPKSNSPSPAPQSDSSPKTPTVSTAATNSVKASTTVKSKSSSVTSASLNGIPNTLSNETEKTPSVTSVTSIPPRPGTPVAKPKQKPIPIVPKPYAGFVSPPWKPRPKVKVPVKIAPKSGLSEVEASTTSTPTSCATSSATSALSNAVSLLQSNGITVSTSPSTASATPKTPKPSEPPKKATSAPVVGGISSSNAATNKSSSTASSSPSSPASAASAVKPPHSDEDTAKVETAQAILQLSMGFKRSLSPPDEVLSRRINAIKAEMKAVKSEPNSPRNSPSPPSDRERTAGSDPEDSKRRKIDTAPVSTDFTLKPSPKTEVAPLLLTKLELRPVKTPSTSAASSNPPTSVPRPATPAVQTKPTSQKCESTSLTVTPKLYPSASQISNTPKTSQATPVSNSTPTAVKRPSESPGAVATEPKRSNDSTATSCGGSAQAAVSSKAAGGSTQAVSSTPVTAASKPTTEASQTAVPSSHVAVGSKSSVTSIASPQASPTLKPSVTVSQVSSIPKVSVTTTQVTTTPKPAVAQSQASAVSRTAVPSSLLSASPKPAVPSSEASTVSKSSSQASMPSKPSAQTSVSFKPLSSQTPASSKPAGVSTPATTISKFQARSSTPPTKSGASSPLSSPVHLGGSSSPSSKHLSSPAGSPSASLSGSAPVKRPAASPVDAKNTTPTKQPRMKEVDKIAQAIKEKRFQEHPSQKPLNFFFDGISNQASPPAKSRKPVPDLQRLPRLGDRTSGSGSPLDLSAASSPRASDHGGSWTPSPSLAQVLARRQQVNGVSVPAPRPSSLSSSSPSPPADSPSLSGQLASAALLDTLAAQQSFFLQQLHVQSLLQKGLSPLSLGPTGDIWELFGRQQAAAAAAAQAAAGKRGTK